MKIIPIIVTLDSRSWRIDAVGTIAYGQQEQAYYICSEVGGCTGKMIDETMIKLLARPIKHKFYEQIY